jgi:hypothetical protein
MGVGCMFHSSTPDRDKAVAALGLTQPPYSRYRGSFLVQSDRGVKLTLHTHPLPRFGPGGATRPAETGLCVQGLHSDVLSSRTAVLTTVRGVETQQETAGVQQPEINPPTNKIKLSPEGPKPVIYDPMDFLTINVSQKHT